MKVTITGYIVATQYSWESKPSFTFQWYEPEQKDTVVVRAHSFEVDVPDNFDVRPGLVANLERERQKLREEFGLRIVEIEKQISELTAIGCEVAA